MVDKMVDKISETTLALLSANVLGQVPSPSEQNVGKTNASKINNPSAAQNSPSYVIDKEIPTTSRETLEPYKEKNMCEGKNNSSEENKVVNNHISTVSKSVLSPSAGDFVPQAKQDSNIENTLDNMNNFQMYKPGNFYRNNSSSSCRSVSPSDSGI